MFYLTIILITMLIISIEMSLEYIDSKIDYKNKNILFNFYMDNGLYIRVPYLNWQRNKKKFIEMIFAEEVCHEGKTYITTAIFKDQGHLKREVDLLPSFFYRDYMAALELKRNSSSKIITNNTKIIGNHNTVVIEQNEINEITYKIDELLKSDIDDLDRQCIELFKYKLKENSVTDIDKNRVLVVLSKLSKYAPYASLASSIINLVKSLLP